MPATNKLSEYTYLFHPDMLEILTSILQHYITLSSSEDLSPLDEILSHSGLVDNDDLATGIEAVIKTMALRTIEPFGIQLSYDIPLDAIDSVLNALVMLPYLIAYDEIMDILDVNDYSDGERLGCVVAAMTGIDPYKIDDYVNAVQAKFFVRLLSHAEKSRPHDTRIAEKLRMLSEISKMIARYVKDNELPLETHALSVILSYNVSPDLTTQQYFQLFGKMLVNTFKSEAPIVGAINLYGVLVCSSVMPADIVTNMSTFLDLFDLDLTKRTGIESKVAELIRNLK